MPTEPLTAIAAVRLIVIGHVQGLGVRPSVARFARQLELRGVVANTASGLLIEIIGSPESIARFQTEWSFALPDGVCIASIQSEPISVDARTDFEIAPSTDSGPLAVAVPRDRVACHECLNDVLAPEGRRHHYPLTSCSGCGPRYSLINSMPYDRARTSLHAFQLCAACAGEYDNQADRRYHAQTNACPICGPQVRAVTVHGKALPLDDVAHGLLAGQIVALPGLGGYQLLVDATSHTAVERLRARKGRRTKPFAVMVRDLDEAQQFAVLDDTEQQLLADSSGPIVIVQRRPGTSLAPAIAPHFETLKRDEAPYASSLPTCGLMLPTTPLHALLLQQVQRPLVVTSGNHEGGVLVFDAEHAARELADIADIFVHHDRAIVRPIDDSVVRVLKGRTCVLRLARGLAPFTLPPLPIAQPLIALGGQMKNAIAIWNGTQAALGPHVGDLDHVAVCTRWEEQLRALAALYGVKLEDAQLVCDEHPDYFTSHWAAEFSAAQSGHNNRHSVFHHHAHVAAVMWEHQLVGPVLGLAWDGTGYGPDGTIWGSEALLATRADFRRVAALRPFPLPGGELAIREPWRLALALVQDSLGVEAARQLAWPDVSAIHREGVLKLLTRPQVMPTCSSMGRLFDAVAALALGISHGDEEGRAAMLLELAADRMTRDAYSLEINSTETTVADWRPLIANVMTDRQRGVSPEVIAMRFHRALANWVQGLAQRYEERPLVLSGGCFQNGLLRELITERVGSRRAGVFVPTLIPPGDGGLAAGQLAIAAARMAVAQSTT